MYRGDCSAPVQVSFARLHLPYAGAMRIVPKRDGIDRAERGKTCKFLAS